MKKICSRCGVEQEVDQYRLVKSKNRKNNYISGVCRSCKRQTDREYLARRGYDDRARAAQRRYRERHPDRIKERKTKPKLSSPIYVCVCEVTGGLFVGRRKGVRYSEAGRKIKYQEYLIKSKEKSYKKYNTQRIRLCRICDREYDKIKGGYQLYCSNECRKRGQKIMGSKHKDRARYYGVESEPINPIQVFARDNWRCQMCGVKTPIKLRGRQNDNAPVLDHIVPISKGGPHLYSNVQCSCWRCNSQKGNKMIGQLRAVV